MYYVSMLELKLIVVSKRSHRYQMISMVDDFEQYRSILHTFNEVFTGNYNVRYQQNVTQMRSISILIGLWITPDDIANICHCNILHFVNLDHHLYILINPYNTTPEICTRFPLSRVSIAAPEKSQKGVCLIYGIYVNSMRSSNVQ